METPVEQLPSSPSTRTNVLSIISLAAGILGFLGICLGIIPFFGWVCSGIGGLFGVVALVTGLIGMNQVRKDAGKGKGMAIAGIVLGALTVLGICLSVIITLLGPAISNTFTQIMNSLNTP